MKADIWMPLYIADYLADTAYLTTEQSGAYLHLLMAYWRCGPPPDNDAVLASITRLSPDAWSNARALLVTFFEVTDGVWRNKRADQEIEKAKANRKVRQDKALRAAEGRWGKTKNKPEAMLGACPEQSSNECPSPSPMSVTTDVVTERASRSKSVTVKDLVGQHSVDPQVAADFIQLRRAKGAPLSVTAFNGLVAEYGKAGLTIEQGIRVQIDNGWQGFKATWLKRGDHGTHTQPARLSAADRVRLANGGSQQRTFDNAD